MLQLYHHRDVFMLYICSYFSTGSRRERELFSLRTFRKSPCSVFVLCCEMITAIVPNSGILVVEGFLFLTVANEILPNPALFFVLLKIILNVLTQQKLLFWPQTPKLICLKGTNYYLEENFFLF